MKIGSTAAYTYAFKGTDMGIEDYLDSIRTLGQMGFRFFDLEILEEQHVAIYLTERNITRIKKACAEHQMTIAGFTAWACVRPLHSSDPRQHKKCFELFKQMCEIAGRLDADYIHLGSDMIDEYVVHRDPTYVSAPPMEVVLPVDVKLDAVLNAYAERLGSLAGIAAATGLKFSIEPRANALINGAEGFLNLARRVAHENLYCCLDVMHGAFHRENIPLAIEKLGQRLLILQMCDSRPGEMVHHPLGMGDVNLQAIMEALAKIQYDRYVMLEIYHGGNDDRETVDRWYRDALAWMAAEGVGGRPCKQIA